MATYPKKADTSGSQDLDETIDIEIEANNEALRLEAPGSSFNVITYGEVVSITCKNSVNKMLLSF